MKNIFPQNLFYCQDEEGGGGGRTAGGGAQHKVNVAMCANRLSPSSSLFYSHSPSLCLYIYLFCSPLLLLLPSLVLTRCCQFARLVRRI